MNRLESWSLVMLVLSGLMGCSRTDRDEKAPVPATPDAGPVTFVDRVWKVAESTGMTPGQLVVFLSDSTLVFASPADEPSLGTWGYVGGSLTMVEEGIPYTVEILGLTVDELRLRSHNPGAPVETRFVRADG